MAKRLRLLSIGHSYVVGVNRQLPAAMQQVAGDRWEVTVAAPKYFAGHRDIRDVPLQFRENESIPLVPLQVFNTSQIHTFWYGWGLSELLNRDWDIIHAWEEPYIFAGAQLATLKPSRSKFVFRTAQSLNKLYPPPFGWLESLTLSRSAGWICSGQTVQENLLMRPSYARLPWTRTPLGVDLKNFKCDPESGKAVRRELGWADDAIPVIGYFGRFVPEKGLNLLLRVLSDLKVPWRAVLVGGGPMTQTLKAWETYWGDKLRVLTNVNHDDMPRYLNAADVMVLPSQTTRRWREQFGRIIVESFACGVPVIGSSSGEIPYVIGQDGMVCPEADQKAWVKALEEMLTSAKLRQDFSRRGLERCAEYDWLNVARKTIEFFERLV
jgi:glycosyltransferase involved in cell wall biosynthesis